MNLIRKYKIYKFLGIVDEQTKEFFNYIENKYLNLKLIEDEYDNGWFFYVNEKDECILEYNFKTLNIFYKKVSAKYNTIGMELLIKDILIKEYYIKIYTIYGITNFDYEHYKNTRLLNR